MKMISKFAVSTALVLSLASGLAYAQQTNAPPPPVSPADQQVADNGPDGGPQDCMDGQNWRHHGRGHGHMMRGEGPDGQGGGRGGRMMIIDANGDGFIGPDEAASLADGMFTCLDQNHDNVIDETEAAAGPGKHGWRAWIGQQQAADITAKLKQAFIDRDTNKDGKVTKEEFMAYAQAKYAALDAARDGKVSPWAFHAQPKL